MTSVARRNRMQNTVQNNTEYRRSFAGTHLASLIALGIVLVLLTMSA